MAYINKDLLLNCLEDLAHENLIGNDNDTFISLPETQDRIEELSTADVVEVKHGYWEVEKGAFELCGVKFYKCSVCNREQQLNYPYCPNCGAKMDLEVGG